MSLEPEACPLCGSREWVAMLRDQRRRQLLWCSRCDAAALEAQAEAIEAVRSGTRKETGHMTTTKGGPP